MKTDGEAPPSHLKKFQESQARAEALSEAFRRAVNTDSDSSLGAAWKETLLQSLAQGEIERIFVGPGKRIRVISQDRVQSVDVPSPEDVLDWADSLLPAPPDWAEVRDGVLQRRLNDGGKADLSVTRSPSPEGDWFVITQPWASFPVWSDLGLEEDLASRIDTVEGKAVLLVAPTPQLGRISIAAWLNRRAKILPTSGWIVEPYPSYAWSRLPGRLDSVSPQRFSRPGDLVRLRDLTGAGVLVLNGVREGWLLAEGLGLAAEGTRVVLSICGASVSESVQRLDEWLHGSRGTAEAPRAAGKLGAAWQVQPTGGADGPTLRSRFVLQKGSSK